MGRIEWRNPPNPKSTTTNTPTIDNTVAMVIDDSLDDISSCSMIGKPVKSDEHSRMSGFEPESTSRRNAFDGVLIAGKTFFVAGGKSQLDKTHPPFFGQ